MSAIGISSVGSVRTELLPIVGTKAKYVRENTVGTPCTRSTAGLLRQLLQVFAVLRGSALLPILFCGYFRARAHSGFATTAAVDTP